MESVANLMFTKELLSSFPMKVQEFLLEKENLPNMDGTVSILLDEQGLETFFELMGINNE